MIFKDNTDHVVELFVYGTEEKLSDEGHMLREALQYLRECEHIEEFSLHSFEEQEVILELNRSITKGIRTRDLLSYEKEKTRDFPLDIYYELYDNRKMMN